MDAPALEKYLAEDYAKALKFYDDRACTSKRAWRALSIYLIVASAVLTPLVAFAPDLIGWRIAAASLSATLVVATGLLAHLRSHENWLSYRASWDALERERRLFETGTGPYSSAPDRASLFVGRVETVLTKEGTDFSARHAHAEKRDGNADKPGTA
ncbi:MAG: DUF4231 domain-containing protein [Planctomycetes bacterium]|nr:DUF4231 domain-containing protein [Planctomycetota bacterium]